MAVHYISAELPTMAACLRPMGACSGHTRDRGDVTCKHCLRSKLYKLDEDSDRIEAEGK